MFRKLLSNLPFNPSLINQVSFYAKRVHQEQGIRRSGMVLVVLAMLLQVFAVIAPPEQSFARPGNDIIPGGFTRQSTAVDYCERNTYNFRNILAHPYIDVSCAQLAKATTRTIRSTDYDRKLLSLGRSPYDKPGERKIYPAGENAALYMRYLWGWDSGLYSSYQALVGTNSKGKPFMVLYDCGNPVIVESTATPPANKPAPTVKRPNVQITSKTTLPGTPPANSTVHRGDVLGYRIYFRNAGDAAATNVFVEDSIPDHTTFVKGSQGSGKANRYAVVDTVYPGHAQEIHAYWAYNSMPAGATGYYVDFKTRVNSGTQDGQKICNRAYIRSVQNAQTWSNLICHTVDVPSVSNPPKDECPNIAGIQSRVPTGMIRTSGNCVYPAVSADVCLNIAGIQTSVPADMARDSAGNCNYPAVTNKPCSDSQNQTDTDSCWEQHKTAINRRTGKNANSTTAKAGDTIVYTLTAINKANVSAPTSDDVNQENLIDVMEYAETATAGSGGTLGSDKIVRWPVKTVAAGKTITRKLTVKIKSKIPQTPTPPSNPGSFDLMLTNVYGDAINIKLPGSVAKAIDHTNTTVLPNTGPGETITVAVLITMLAAYFFARSRLMAKELDIVREEYATSGGV